MQALVTQVKSSSGFLRKRAISPIVGVFAEVWRSQGIVDPIGDDAAVIEHGGEYLLLTCDAIIPDLVEADPFWAGYCAVLVGVNDICAMGGTVLAAVNVLGAREDGQGVEIARGMREACVKFGVPMVGGHVTPGAPPGVATAVLGRASKLLRGFGARPGHRLLAAVDVEGRRVKQYLQWDCTSFRSPAELRRRLAVLPRLAGEGRVVAARDISNAGLLGTAVMLMEASGCGAAVDLDAVPRPEAPVPFSDWLQMFPGYGFLLAVEPEAVDEVKSAFSREGIAAERIGVVTGDRRVVLRWKGEEALLFDGNVETLVVKASG